MISLCRNPGCVSERHHVIGTPSEARAFGRKGRIGIGELVLARQIVNGGRHDIGAVADNWGVAKELLLEAISRLGSK